ncbi:BA75_03075T0 [Komagataella pastoris]|uniref:BA75_03075T0 n=1 Tax=Komagataella pastoris TaxID=4922 RepID=A0A1B2JE25_PICPA|nr:BA75_03075T0 [Komagataella pastoris]
MGQEGEKETDRTKLHRYDPKQSQYEEYKMYRERSFNPRDNSSVNRKRDQSPTRPTFNIGPSGILDQEDSKDLKSKSTTEKERKYSEPPEKSSPQKDKFYIFLFNDIYPDGKRIALNNSFYTLGNTDDCDFKLSDVKTDQVNTVIQFRKIKGIIKPYVIDLASTIGTNLNDIPIPSKRYLELKNSDSIIIGDSSSEFIFMITG